MSRYETTTELQQLIKFFKSSSLNKKDFCKKHNIARHILYKAIKQCAPELLGAARCTSKPLKAKFIPISSKKKSKLSIDQDKLFVINIANKIKMEFPSGFDIPYLKELVEEFAK
jgi:hypothetical protein